MQTNLFLVFKSRWINLWIPHGFINNLGVLHFLSVKQIWHFLGWSVLLGPILAPSKTLKSWKSLQWLIITLLLLTYHGFTKNDKKWADIVSISFTLCYFISNFQAGLLGHAQNLKIWFIHDVYITLWQCQKVMNESRYVFQSWFIWLRKSFFRWKLCPRVKQ